MRGLVAWSVLAAAMLTPVGLYADEGAAPGGQQPPVAAGAPLDGTPVPPPSGPYPAPMMMRKPFGESLAGSADTGGAGQQASPAGEAPPAMDAEPRYAEPSTRPQPTGHAWQPADMGASPSYRPWDPSEAPPAAAAAPQPPVQEAPEEAQKMQADQQSVKNTPAVQSEPSTSRPTPTGGGYPPRPGYGYGYPAPPGYGYPPGGYGYGYPPRPYGYPGQPAVGQRSSTQAQ